MPRVQCYVYDISQGMARMMSMPLLGKQVDIIPHSGIVCFGKEYFFGGGVCVTAAGQSVPMPPCEVLDLGEAQKSEAELNAFLAQISPQYTVQTYNLLKHNCNHFANEVAKFLCDNGVPDRIVNIADEALSTPQGQQMRGLIENFESQMRQNNGANQLNPFGNTTSTMPATGGSASASSSAAPAGANSMDTSTSAGALADFERAVAEVRKVEDVERKRACFATLNKMCANIHTNPTEEKYRKIKMENPAFNKKVAECDGGTECILALGFAPEEVDGVDFWVAAPAPTPPPQTSFGASGMTNPLLNNFGGGMPPPTGGMPGGPLPGGIPPGMAQQAQQMMASNPQMASQAQQLMNNPQQMQQLMNDPQIQAMLNNPQAMQSMMNMMNQQGPR
eukprot:g9429.t1